MYILPIKSVINWSKGNKRGKSFCNYIILWKINVGLRSSLNTFPLIVYQQATLELDLILKTYTHFFYLLFERHQLIICHFYVAPRKRNGPFWLERTNIKWKFDATLKLSKKFSWYYGIEYLDHFKKIHDTSVQSPRMLNFYFQLILYSVWFKILI